MRSEDEARLRKLVNAGEQEAAERLYLDLTGAPPDNAAAGLRKLLAEGDVRLLLSSGRKIEAIKLYRETLGCSLVEAHQAIQKLEDARPAPPAGANPLTSGKGLPLVILVACLALMIIAALTLRLFFEDDSPEEQPLPPVIPLEQPE